MEYLQNLEKEYKDICAKKGALAHFIEYGNHDNLNDGEVGLLSVQYATMEAYHSVLYQRKRLVAQGLTNSVMKELVEGKTCAELFYELKNGMRDL
jgi:hypothetical protein